MAETKTDILNNPLMPALAYEELDDSSSSDISTPTPESATITGADKISNPDMGGPLTPSSSSVTPLQNPEGKGEDTPKKRHPLIVTAIIILFLLLGSAFAFVNHRANSRYDQLEAAQSSLQQQLNDADNLKTTELKTVAATLAAIRSELDGDIPQELEDQYTSLLQQLQAFTTSSNQQIAQTATTVLAELTNQAGEGIAVSGAHGTTISNTGVTSLNGQAGNLSLQGTPNQINVTQAGSTAILSTPQDIATTSSPTFANQNVVGNTTTDTLAIQTSGTQNGHALCDISNNCNYSGAGSSFVQGGNSFGMTATLGTNDNQSLNLETNGTTKMTVLTNGNVGIGTATPNARLQLAQNVFGEAVLLRLHNPTTNNAGSSSILFTANSSEREYAKLLGGRDVNGSSESGMLGFHTRSLTGGLLERMRINQWGNVGIGTTNPSIARLYVQGDSISTIGQIIQGAAGQTANLQEWRNSTGTVLASVNTVGAGSFANLLQGGNQVCDASNNCDYAPASGSGNYIQNGTATQTANFNISGNGTIGTDLNVSGSTTTNSLVVATSATIGTTLGVTGDVSIGANSSLKLVGGTSFPLSPTEGQVFYRSDSNQLYVYDGTRWQADRSSVTYIVAASNSVNKEKADFVGDGTNDQNAINAAIDALPSTGGAVVLLDGTFNLTGTVAINKSNTTLQGQGSSTVLRRMWDSSAAEGVVTVGGNGTANYATITNLKIDGNKATYANVNNLGLQIASSCSVQARNARVMDNTIINTASHAIHASGACSNSIEGYYGNNTIISPGGAGINLTTSGNTASVIGNKISGAAVGVQWGDGQGVILDNTITAGSIGMQISSAFVTIANNLVFSNTSHGIIYRSFSGSYATSITGNVVKSNGGHGIVVSNNASIPVTGNAVSDNTGIGIQVEANLNNVLGNRVSNNGAGITISGNNNVIESNVLSENGGTGGNSSISTTNGLDNKLVNNTITDSVGTGWAIAINPGCCNIIRNVYLSGNTYSGAGASSIQDLGIATIWDNQMDANGNLVTRGQAGVAFNGTTSSYSLQNTGSFVQGGIATPAAPTVAAQGTTGATSWSYAVTAYDGLGETLASTATTVTTGNATLDGSNFNRITPTRVNGAVSYRVYRTAAGGTPSSTGYIGTVAGGATTFYLDDTGLTATGTAPVANTTGTGSFVNLLQGGNQVCDISNNCGYASSSGSTSYIQNGTSAQTANFNITGNGVIGGKLAIGTAITSDYLAIDGNEASGVGIYIRNQSTASGAGAGFRLVNNVGKEYRIGVSSSGSPVSSALVISDFISGTGVPRLIVTTTGNVGIGAPLPASLLSVGGTTGNFQVNTSGTVVAGTWQGAALADPYVTDALTISSAGSVADGALSSNVALYNATTANFTGTLQQASNQVCDISNNCGYAPGSGSANYIQNGTGAQTANFNVSGTGTVGTLQIGTVATFADSSGNLQLSIPGSGSLRIANASAAQFRLLPSGNDIQFQNTLSSGNIYFTGLNGAPLTGDVIFRGTGGIGMGAATPGAKLHVVTATTQVGQIIQGSVGQTANLQEWRDNNNTVLAGVSAIGNMGIGATPSTDANYKLTVGAEDPYIRFNMGTASTHAGGLRFFQGTTATERARIGYSNGVAISSYVGDMNLSTTSGSNIVLNACSDCGSSNWQRILIRSSGSNSGFAYSYGENDRTTFNNTTAWFGQNVGIGPTTPGARLHVQASAAGAIATVIQGAISQTANLQEWQSNTGAILASLSATGDLSVVNATVNGTLAVTSAATFNNTLTVNGHIITGNTSGNTTIGPEAGAGTGASVAIDGNDTSGTITLTTGTGAAMGDLATIAFANAYGAAPRVTLTPDNLAAANLPYYTNNRTTAGFTLSTSGVPDDATVYVFSYQVMQ